SLKSPTFSIYNLQPKIRSIVCDEFLKINVPFVIALHFSKLGLHDQSSKSLQQWLEFTLFVKLLDIVIEVIPSIKWRKALRKRLLDQPPSIFYSWYHLNIFASRSPLQFKHDRIFTSFSPIYGRFLVVKHYRWN